VGGLAVSCFCIISGFLLTPDRTLSDNAPGGIDNKTGGNLGITGDGVPPVLSIGSLSLLLLVGRFGTANFNVNFGSDDESKVFEKSFIIASSIN
jgi:hypothetical protein